MKNLKIIAIAAVFSVILATVVPAAKAEIGDMATKINVDQPLKIGNLVLVPGVYELRLADFWQREAVEIYSETAHHYVGIVMGLPANRTYASEQPVFTMERPSPDSPEALRYWYPPFAQSGIEFVYPHAATGSVSKTGNLKATAHVAG